MADVFSFERRIGMRLIDADKLIPINAPIAAVIRGELTHYEKIVFWKTIYDAPTINVLDRVLEIIETAILDYKADVELAIKKNDLMQAAKRQSYVHALKSIKAQIATMEGE